MLPLQPRTYYERPIALRRLTGRYTVEWYGQSGERHVERAHTRVTDFAGNLPSFHSLVRVPRSIRTWIEIRQHPILKSPLPMMAFGAIEFLRRITGAGTRVLEIGGGNSTLWLLERGVSVTTIEGNQGWAGYVERAIGERLDLQRGQSCRIEALAGAQAVGFVEAEPAGSYDVVIVDSSNGETSRVECIRVARRVVAPNGWLVLDDSDHPINRPAFELMAGYPHTAFSGYGPMTLTVSRTSFWQIGAHKDA